VGRFRPAQPQHVQTTHQKENARTSRAFVFLSFSSCGIFHYLRQRFFTYLTQFSLSLAPDTTATHLPKSIKGLYLGPSPPCLLRYGFSPPLRGLFLDQKRSPTAIAGLGTRERANILPTNRSLRLRRRTAPVWRAAAALLMPTAPDRTAPRRGTGHPCRSDRPGTQGGYRRPRGV